MAREFIIEFPGGPKRVDTKRDKFVIKTDSPVESGGEGLFASPGATFLAGLGACTASTGRTYCRNHNLPIPKQVRMLVHSNEEGEVENIEFDFIMPADFPEDHFDALLRAAGLCDVKKMWKHFPEFASKARHED